MKSPFYAASFLVAAVSTSGATEPLCTIVSIESTKTYYHELCHCNGWEHPFGEDAVPPAWCLHRYPGPLQVIVPDGDPILNGTVARLAQPGASVEYSPMDAETLCRDLWQARMVRVPPRSEKVIIGCAIK